MECLKSLWRLGEASVKQVKEDLEAQRPLAYTTVMTLLERLVRRGRAGRRKQSRAFYYSAVASRSELRKLAVDELVLVHFDGSRGELQTYLNGAGASVTTHVDAPESRLDTSLL